MVIDVVMFNGEYDLFKLRYDILKDYVDEFILVEAPTTFSGKPKPLYSLESNKVFYDSFDQWTKVKVFIIDENYTTEEIRQSSESSNTKGASHWKHEFLQKESIKKALTHLKDDDIVFIGDCDEIWEPEIEWQNFTGSPFKLELSVYTYYLNNKSSEKFYGTLYSKYLWLKRECLNHLRVNAWKTSFKAGWHFTSMASELRRKLTDSYTEESYASPEVMNTLEDNIKNNRDFLGRGFTYKVDETDWPPWLKEHREDYKHLLKP